jgi:hypothetical protein
LSGNGAGKIQTVYALRSGDRAGGGAAGSFQCNDGATGQDYNETAGDCEFVHGTLSLTAMHGRLSGAQYAIGRNPKNRQPFWVACGELVFAY